MKADQSRLGPVVDRERKNSSTENAQNEKEERNSKADRNAK
jgi:hypothetical protein